MGQRETARRYATEKMQILEKIAANTETQCRFIHKREMRGLGRVLRERGVLLEQLSMLSNELAKDQDWKGIPDLASMIRDVNDQQQAVLARSMQVLQQAVAEHELIAIELKNSKVQRQVKNRYVNPWAVQARGGHINARG